MRRLRVRGLVSRASWGLRRHRPAQLHGSVRQRAGGADESGRKPVESRAFEWAPLSVSRRRSRGLRKTPQWSAERRAGPRYGPAVPSRWRDRSDRKTGRRVRRSAPANFGAPLPSFGTAKGSNTKFGTTARRDAPRGNAPPRLNNIRRRDDAGIKEDGPRGTSRFGETNPRASEVRFGGTNPRVF